MTAELATVRAWDADGVAVEARRLATLAEELDRVYDALSVARTQLVAGWDGAAARAADDRVARAAAVSSRLAAVLREVGVVLAGSTADLGEAVRLARLAAAVSLGHATEPVWGAAGGPVACRATRIAADTDGRTGRALASAASVTSATSPASAAGSGAARGPLAPIRSGSSYLELCAALGLRSTFTPDPLPPPPDTSAAGVAEWWRRLPRDVRLRLVDEQPWWLGATAGLPAWVRDRMNRSRLAATLQVLRAEWGRVTARVSTAQSAVRLAAEVRRRLTVAEAVELQLGRLAAGGRPAQLLTLDLDGAGRAAIVVGDLDRADHVAFLVPGLAQDVRRGLASSVEHATWLQDQARGLTAPTGPAATGTEAGPDVAVVAWVAYPAPGLAQVPFAQRARQGGRLLGHELDGLTAARGSRPPHVTLVGHSYGSTTVAAAVTGRWVDADDLVFVGSPGVLATTVADLGRSGEHVFVGEARFDWVGDLAAFGADPARAGFGATRFRADPEAGWSPERAVGGDHMHYFDPGSESLRNIARVVVGRAAQVTRQSPEPAEPSRDPPQGELCPGPC